MNKIRMIATYVDGNKANEILSSVIGQMSDGMFENSNYYEGFWRFVSIDKNNNICIETKYGKDVYCRYCKNKFYDMSDSDIRKFFAKLIKRIIQEELRDKDIPVRGKFVNGNMMPTSYLNYYEEVTIDDCVTLYNVLMKY